MADLTLAAARLKGTVAAPPAKSMAHRGLILAALSGGSAEPLLQCDDIAATKKCMEALLKGEADFDCDESASTLRFLIPLAMALRGGGRFFRGESLQKRPIDVYETLFPDAIFHGGDPLMVSGRLLPTRYTLSGAVSSQFVSGLLMALPLVSGDSEIQVLAPFESKAYVDLTLQAMRAFGMAVERSEEATFFIGGNRRYKPRDFHIEGDYSQAAVFLVLRALGHEIEVTNLKPDSLQGDKAILDILANTPDVVDAAQYPDIIPMVALYLCLREGTFSIVNGGRLRLKECDRLAATATLLAALGADIVIKGDGLRIKGVKRLRGGVTVDCRGDHRMAMMLAAAALQCVKPIVLTGIQCVNKSWPGFFDTYFSLGGRAL